MFMEIGFLGQYFPVMLILNKPKLMNPSRDLNRQDSVNISRSKYPVGGRSGATVCAHSSDGGKGLPREDQIYNSNFLHKNRYFSYHLSIIFIVLNSIEFAL